MKKHTLKDIVDDYIVHMQGINEKRLDLLTKDLQCVKDEGALFNLLMNNVKLLEETANGVS
jgi:hypothetical protein